MLASSPPSWGKEAEQFLLIVLAELSTHPHVPDDCARDTRRQTFRRIVASGAILLQDALPFRKILGRIRRGGLRRSGFRCSRLFLRPRRAGLSLQSGHEPHQKRSDGHCISTYEHLTFLSKPGRGSDRRFPSPKCCGRPSKRTGASSR